MSEPKICENLGGGGSLGKINEIRFVEDKPSFWKKTFKQLTQSIATAILVAVIFGGSVFGQVTDPTGQWLLPGFPNTDGGYQYPLWNGAATVDGSTYNDAIISTGAHRLHAIGITGQGVSAAVLDTLFDVNHPAIQNNIIYAAQYTTGEAPNGGLSGAINVGTDFVETHAYAKGYDPVLDFPGVPYHGTHVAGIVLSMAPNAGLVLLNSSAVTSGGEKVQDFSETDVLIDHAADIASQYNIVSLNGSYSHNLYYNNHNDADTAKPEEAAAINKLVNAGVIGIFASGNNGFNNYIKAPAAITDAVAVGALHPWGVVTDFSNQSEMVVLLAPGASVNSSRPVLNSPTTFEHGYAVDGGTSMAAPHVTGGIALISSGARMASGEEILQSMIDSADPYTYDGSVVLPNGYTLDTWRDLWAFTFSDKFVNDPLEHIDYRFLRVDKAYMDLTHKRMHNLGNTVGLVDEGLDGIFHGYANELYAGLDYDTSQVFQRLDFYNGNSNVLTWVARQMSPRFTNATVESSQLGLVGIHRGFGRRTEMNRLAQGSSGKRSDSVCEPCEPCQPCNPCGSSDVEINAWVEGFGSEFNQQGSLTNGAYDGSFAGSSFGYERTRKGLTAGIFGNYSNHRLTGDGRADGDWVNIGGYGRIDRRKSFAEVSLAYGFGEYDMTRNIIIPGAVFSGAGPGAAPIVLPTMFKQAVSKFDTDAFSMRLATGRDLGKINGWKFGPRAELSLAHVNIDAYTEDGAQSLNLAMQKFGSTYLEGGLGLFAGKLFRLNDQHFVATGKVMGMYGGSMGGDMYGNYRQFNSPFHVDPNHSESGWVVPETTLSWNLTDGIVLSGSYFGRFGEKYNENSGSVALNLYW